MFLAGRIVAGAYYLFSAFNHFARFKMMSAFAASRHVPLPQVAVFGAGVLLAIAGLSFLLGILPRIGVGAVVLFLIPVTVMMHPFWADRDPGMRMMDMVNFTKNFALLGSALMFLAVPEPWPYRVRLPIARTAPARLAPR
jgi:putative oxidoreductase